MAVIMRNADSYRHRTDFEYEYEYDDRSHGEPGCSSERADGGLVSGLALLAARH
jgi:hypothetical protein